jgi:hypothetical protein
MAKKPWEVPDQPKFGDTSNDITFRAVGQALSQWEWFEGNLSLAFSYLIGTGYGNIAASRAYGSVEVFRVRKNLIENAAEVYFKYTKDDHLQAELESLLKQANEFSGRRNEIAHGIVNQYFAVKPGVVTHKGWVLYPAYYATRKRKLPEKEPLTDITPTYAYSSVEIEYFGREFSKLAQKAIEILTRLTQHEQGKKLR